jgi:flavin reductase (DIM6/NTAB) family NADH-FMN oxidoreductase RutF
MEKCMEEQCRPVENLFDFISLMGPSRPVLVTSRFRDGRVNVAPFSWCIPVSQNPPMLALALLTTPRRQRSLINILREREFVANVPGPELAERMVMASYWYPKGVNKLEFLKFKTAPARVVDAPILAECRAHIECRLMQALPLGDHTTLIAAVVAADFDPGTYGPGYLLDLGKTSPLLHLRHFNTADGQVHVFYTGNQSRTANVPFPPGGMDSMGRPVGDEED